MTAPQNSNGLKAVTGILALFAVVGGVYATVEPMTQKIDMLQTLLEKKEVEVYKSVLKK